MVPKWNKVVSGVDEKCTVSYYSPRRQVVSKVTCVFGLWLVVKTPCVLQSFCLLFFVCVELKRTID